MMCAAVRMAVRRAGLALSPSGRGATRLGLRDGLPCPSDGEEGKVVSGAREDRNRVSGNGGRSFTSASLAWLGAALMQPGLGGLLLGAYGRAYRAR